MSQQPQQPPQGGQYEPPPGYVLAKKKRKKWPWVLGALVLLIVIIAATSAGEDGESASSPAGAGQPAAPGAAPDAQEPAAAGITYEVISGDASGTASVTYTSDENFNQAQENGVDLPWAKTVDLGNGFFNMASVVAQAGQGVDSITCRITDGEEVISENTSTGEFAVVTCSGS